MKQTPFNDRHVALGAKMHEFAGYMMPISYTGINHEHLQIREKIGVFDVSHMGEFLVEGKYAEDFLQYITTNDVKQLVDGQAQYSAMCYPDGGIVDDLIVYRFSKNKYMMVVNASNIEKDYTWAGEHLMDGVTLSDHSDKTALLAIQGPKTLKILQTITDVPLKDIGFYHFAEGKLAGKKMIISRTGYTGEPGFELYHDPKDSLELWDAIFKAGKNEDIQAVGLAARDTLRLEMKYALYGNDIDKDTNPIEAGLGWITKLNSDDFIGKAELVKIKEEKPAQRLIAFKMLDRGIPRQGYDLYYDDTRVGKVTSGTMSPSLGIGIGTGYVQRDFSKIGTEIYLDVRGKRLKAIIVKPPFVDSTPLEL
ncbi:MAG: glycine cleavage system aminomethyltransferase GcvT [Candidatus Marinimicrobia bacterium]|nr:glycine cleavage system aminomethyltransferase GcvT [Candidatus Neomarinimicrobiota bacterium]